MLYAELLNNKGRPVHKMMHYVAAYERHFGHLVGRPCTFLEIGAGNGGSSQMWKKWFGPLARIVTIDIKDLCRQFEDEQVAVRIGDQTDQRFLQSLIDEFGLFDAVLDDGSHHMAHVVESLKYLYPRMSPSSVYMVEDVHTAYWSEYGGGLNRPDTIVAFFKDMIDKINRTHVREASIESDDFSQSTFCLSAYDSILVFEKARYVNKANLVIGDETLRTNY